MKFHAEQLWRESRILTGTGLLMFGAFLLFCAGLVLDPRTIGGAPAWLKPAKFGISTAIYTWTLAWMYTYLSGRRRLKRIVGGITGGVVVIEVAIIALQAWRGTTSHFNTSTPLDAFLFAVMGVAILTAWIASIALTAALFRQRFADEAMGWAIRLGLLITVIGAASGGLMTRPTRAQLETARIEHKMPIAGAHTVGAPDGGPGVPGTGWSREHGDLRVAHFMGLHAAQLLPLLAWALGSAGPARTRRNAMFVAGTSYAGLFVLLFWQALRGQSVIEPDGTTAAVLALWGVGTAAGAFLVFRSRRSGREVMTANMAVSR